MEAGSGISFQVVEAGIEMNLHTFKDVVNAKKSSLVNDLDEGDEEKEVGVLRKPVEGEEDNGDDKV